MSNYTHEQFERVPTLSEVDPKDYAAVHRARAQHIREEWVKVMEARIVRETMAKCYRTEGVNHYEQCRHLVELYGKLRGEYTLKGYLKPQDN